MRATVGHLVDIRPMAILSDRQPKGTTMAARDDESLDEARFELANEPTIQHFLGGLLKKAKRVVKSGVDLAKKGMRAIRLQPILKRLVGLVRPLIQRVLKLALHLLPARLRPAAS